MVKIAIIGGTGLDDPAFLSERKELPAPYDTPYGKSTNQMTGGILNGVEVVLVARHGKGHKAPPSCINYRANIYAIVNILKCDAIIATNAVGSLRADLHKVGDLAIVDQFIDYTAHGGGLRGPHTFFDGQPGHLEGVLHCPMAEPFSQPIRELLLQSAKKQEVTAHDGATMVVIEGPRFSSKAEHNMFRKLDGHIIGMTMVPEVCLANELGIPYSSIAIITDLDIEGDTHSAAEHVSHDLVLQNMAKFSKRMTVTIAGALPEVAKLDLEKMNKRKIIFILIHQFLTNFYFFKIGPTVF